MALQKRGKWRYGESQADIRDEILRYSQLVQYLAHHYADAVCKCGSRRFWLSIDDAQGAAVRQCVVCDHEHAIGDSDEYLDEAELEDSVCLCGGEEFEITVGLSLYERSEDVRWLFVGCRCPACGLTAVFGDWENEFIGYRKLLSRV